MKHFCPNVPIILVGNKKDLRNDEHTRRELAKMKQVSFKKHFFVQKRLTCAYVVVINEIIWTFTLICVSRSQLNLRRAKTWRTASVPTATKSVLPKPKMAWGRSLRWQLGQHCRARNVPRRTPAFCYRLWKRRELPSSTDGEGIFR